MKIVRSELILFFLISLAIVLSVSFAGLLVRQELERRRSGVEFQAYQIMTGLVDQFVSGESFDPAAWPEISGFGLYEENGSAVYVYGSAPGLLPNGESIPFRGVSALSGTSMALIRRIGALPPAGRPGPLRHRRMMDGLMDGMMDRMTDRNSGPFSDRTPPPPRRALGDRGSAPFERPVRYVFIDIDVTEWVRSGRLILLAIGGLLSVFAVIVIVVVMYSRKLSAYRERERQTAHLVQLGEAARTLAHEIKNPLGVIRVQCATLRRTVSGEHQGNIDIIEEETKRLTRLTDRVGDFLRTSDGNPRRLDAEAFLKGCAARYAGQLTVPLWSGPTPYVRIDESRLTQVLDNLIANALEAASENGPPAEPPEIRLECRKGQVLFRIADRGRGISGENRKRLFEPFFTTKARGSGIGLALSRRFVEQAGGTLTFEDRSGGGSLLTVALPAAAKEGDNES